MRNIILLAVAAAAILVWDHAAGGVLPDDLYCLLGAGYTDRVPPRTTAWHVDPQGGRDIPYQWSAESSVCLHLTLWDGYRIRLQRAGYLKTESTTH